jgi:hypothetical protein
MDPTHLLLLARSFAAHSGSRSLSTVSQWAGEHSRFFVRIAAGGGCRIEAYPRVLAWFDKNWPADLDWPADIERPSARRSRKRRAA